MNESTGKSFDIVGSISYQLPFFCCNNFMLKSEYQKDISKYVYCKEFSISPYMGSFGDQPKKWIDKVNIIKFAIAKKKSKMQSKINEDE
jgi:hypothetical protein